MKRTLLTLLMITICLGAVGGAGFGALSWRFKAKLPKSNYEEPSDLADARAQDLDYLRKLPGVDYSFSQAEQAAFNAHLDQLRKPRHQ